MKRKFFARIVVMLVLVTMLFSVVATTVSAASDTSITVASETKVHGNTGQRRPYTKNLEEINKKLDALTPKEKTYFQKSVNNLKNAKTADQAASIAVSTLMEIATDPDNVNWKNVGIDAATGIINLAASCFCFGGVAQAITGSLAGILKDKSPSEIQLLQDHLDEQFEIVNQGISDIREDISDLSVSVDKSIADAVHALEDAIEAQSAGEKVYAFTFSGEGNFDYTLFKNYLYGTSDSTNELAKYAYYDKLSKAISNNGTDAEIEEYYNALYSGLTTVGNERMPYINVLRQYILEDEYGYSIQRYYYEWLSSNRKMLTDSGKDVEWEAMLFTLDVYKTMLYADHSLAACDNYFLSKIYLEYGSNPSNDAFYKYTSPEGYVTYIKFDDIKKELDNLNNEERELALVIQMIEDITYIFNMENSYMIKDVDGDFYTINNNDSSTFGQVRSGQTVYMNKLTDELCEMFGFDPQNFTYVWSTGEQNTGELEISDGVSDLSVTLCYNGTEIYTVDFEINNNDSFSGGSGTEDDPYLICDASQFALIVMGEDGNGLHYQLINDIDFNNAEQSPRGSVENAFEGIFDGNGYSIKNISITSSANTGLFAKIGEGSTVKNLTLDNMTFSGTQNGNHDIYAGGITAKNEGKIENCHLVDCEIKISRTTSTRGKNIYTYVGGISGQCSTSESMISGCTVTSSRIEGKSERTGKGEDKGKNDDNKNNLYVAGIVAKICDYANVNNCIVEGASVIKGVATTKDSWGDFDVYIDLSVCGAVAFNSMNDHKYIQNIYVSPDVVIERSAYNPDHSNKTKHISGSKYTATPPMIVSVFPPSFTSYETTKRENVSIDKINTTNKTSFSYIGETDIEYNYNENQIYEYNEDFLKTAALKLKVNGSELQEYEIIGHYGLDTLKSDKIDGESGVVTILFTTVLNEETVMLSVDIPIVVEKIDASELIIEALPQIEYERYEDVSLDGGKFVLVWEDGTKEYVTPEITSGNTNAFGSSQIVISYNGVSTTYAIAVKCLHEYVNSTVAPTCTTVGYTEAVCSKCNDRYIVDGSVIDEIEHTIVIKNAVTATCVAGSVGYTGDKYCTVCEELIEKGSVINVLQHEYEYLDGNSCKCKVCKGDKSTKAHEYTSVENDKSIIYSCATCGYSYTVEKKTTTDITRVVVGNSYGLVGSDNEIVVYIKMFNNPGITGVSFRIEYDDRLEYVRYERGELLSAASEFEIAQTNGVIGFVAASPDVYVADGNLLKLVFKLPDNAQVMDSYNISIAYTRKQFTGGQANAIDIVTMDGCITAVTHLPGDVNNDGFVDVLDTALVARYVAISNTKNDELMDEFLESQNYNFSEFYADVNLDGYVDLSDLVIMLQYFVGKNVQELTSNEFEVILNSNNGSLNLESIIVKCYDENGNRGVYPDLPTPTRPGYRFDGWYLSFDVSDLEAERIEAGDSVYYNPTYLKQTLYAHWTEIYTVKYDINAPSNASSVSGSMGDSLYEYDEKKPLASNGFVITGWTFKGWATSPNGAVVYADGAEVSGLAHAGEVITLYAVWERHAYTVEYNSNKPNMASGTVSGTMEKTDCTYDVLTHLNSNKYNLTGWAFKGWSNTPTGDVVYLDGAEIKNLTSKVDGKVVLYAVWEANSYTVKFDANKPASSTSEIIGNMGDVTLDYDSEIDLTNKFTLEGWTFLGWATNVNGTPIYNDKEIVTNLADENDEVVTLYAIWGTKFYTVKYDANKPDCGCVVNGNMSDTNCSYDVPVALKSNGYSIIGHKFKGWATSPSGTVVYADGAEVINLTAVEGGVVTLYAVWDLNEYTIEYEENGGLNIRNTTYTIHNASSITITQAVNDNIYAEYMHFIGWYEDVSFVNVFINDLATNPRNVTLYAKWDLCTVYNDMSTTPDVSDDRVIIDWSNATNTDVSVVRGNGVLSVANTAKELIIIGNPNLTYTNFSISLVDFAKDQELTIRFVDFKFTTNVDGAIKPSGTDNGMNLTIDIKGVCSINTSVARGSIITGFTNTLNITGDGEITIIAGNGANGSTAGANGSNGGTAITVENINIDMNGGTLNVFGGNGGNGATGYAGANGSGNDAPGSNGGNGGNGGNGASAIKCVSITISKTSSVALTAGDGGNGGAGGRGGNGTKDNWPFSAHNGKGGAGGNGGNGGSCSAALTTTNSIINSAITYNEGTVGNGGAGGNGGDGGQGSGGGSAGGAGGAGGWSGDGKVQASSGASGSKGVAN